MIVSKRKYDELVKKYKNLEQANDELIERHDKYVKEKQDIKLQEFEKLKELLDGYEFLSNVLSSGNYWLTSLNISSSIDADEIRIKGGKLYVQDRVKSFDEIMKGLLENINAITKKELYNEIKGIIVKYIKDEKDLRDWQLCFSDTTIMRKQKLKKKVKESDK